MIFSEDAVSIVLNKEHEQATIEFKTPLETNSIAHLSLNFTGILNDRLAGFYRSAYTDQQGTKKYMAVTQFEATDARRCFPCWVMQFFIIYLILEYLSFFF